jgi:Ca2+-binding RTX toxin-like protein
MSSRALVLIALLIGMIVLPATPVAAATSCLGKPATHVMKPGDAPYNGTAGNDVVIGTSGADTIFLDQSGGIDRVCGLGGNDTLSSRGIGGGAEGGTGNDNIVVILSAVGRGGAGNDTVAAYYDGARAEGESGSDTVHAGIGGNADGGSGDDIVTVAQALTAAGGSGDDTITNVEGNPAIDCGSGHDTVTPNGATNVLRCEVVR